MNKIFDYLLSMPDKIALIIMCLVGSIPLGFAFGLGASLAFEFKSRGEGNLIAGLFGTFLGSLINLVIIKAIWI